jgi:nucleoid-associated protein YgaU
VANGLHQLRVDQVTGEGKVVTRVESPFDRAAPDATAAASSATTVVVQPGNSLWRIARRNYGSGWDFTVIYDANREQIRNPDLIYPGQVFALPPPKATN